MKETVRNDESSVRERLKETAAKGRAAVYCVVGAGNGGMAMAAHLGIMGFRVRLYNRTDEHLSGVRWHGGIRLEGELSGFGHVESATSDLGEAVNGADIVMVVVPATAHREIAAGMAERIETGQLVVLNPGRTGGALEFRHVLSERGCRSRPVIAEAQTFLYASRAISRHEAKIHKIKNEVALATLPSHLTPDALRALEPAFPQFTPGGNVLATSMENIGAVFHPAMTILNAGWIEGTRGGFEYYLEGVTPAVARILEAVDAERLAVARALGVRSVSAREWLYLCYGSAGESLFEAIRATWAYRGIKAPPSICHRYIWEDVPMSLVPIASLGSLLGVPTRTIDMVIELASLLHGRDYRSEGRTVERLGLAGLDVKGIHALVTEGDDGSGR
jgi:opine dehydrogenase